MKYIDMLLDAISYKTRWHVCFVVKHENRSHTIGDGIYIFHGKINAIKLDDFRAALSKEVEILLPDGEKVSPSQVNITSMTKL